MGKNELYNKLGEIDILLSKFLEIDDPACDKIDKAYYVIKEEIDNASESDFDEIAKRIDAVILAMDFKIGYTSMLVNQMPELSSIKEKIDSLDLTSNYLSILEDIKEYRDKLNEYFNSLSNYDFLINPYTNQSGKEGLKLSLDSIKSIIENKSYQQEFGSKSTVDFLTDYIKLSHNGQLINKLQMEYYLPVQSIWQKELTTKPNDNNEFNMLVSMITGKTSQEIEFQVNNLLNRPDQHSCSLISNEFIATYKNGIANIGLIYPSDSKIICCGYEDLSSNVFGTGVKNRNLISQMATPKSLIENGKTKALSNGEDLLNSKFYNEVLIDASSKPCGVIVLVNANSETLQDDIVQANILANNLGLPLIQINTQTNIMQNEESGISR